MSVNGRLESSRTLTDLPVEVLSIIFSHLPRSARCHVASVSRYMKDVVEPLLYQSIDMRRLNQKEWYILYSILKARPTLCRHISQLYLTFTSLEIADVPAEFELQDWLLGLSPNLRSLGLDPPKHNVQVQHLTNLRTLRLNYDMNALCYHQPDFSLDTVVSSVETLARHLWMPSLRCLEFHSFDLGDSKGKNPFVFKSQDESGSSQQSPSELQTYHQRTSPITTLRLTDCGALDLGILPDILLSMKKLERFTFGAEDEWEDEDPQFQAISLVSIGMALEPHASSLVELVIFDSQGAKFLETPPSSNLKHYPNLKRLAVPDTFLTAGSSPTIHDRLPSKLEDLQLRYSTGTSQVPCSRRRVRRDRMRELIANKFSWVPRLRRMVWWYHQRPRGFVLPSLESCMPYSRANFLVTELKKIGVEVEWISDPSYHNTPFGRVTEQNL